MTSALPMAATVDVPTSEPAQLFVVVDTEEQFDWHAPYSRARTSVTAMRHIGRVQQVFDRFNLKPTYVIDYPVATQADGIEPLAEIAGAGRCTIGAHLHPWVNPPYSEDVTTRNSFTMNLPVALQRAKLEALTEAITSGFGARPRVFKAGRYGLGAATVDLLDGLGYLVDGSVNPRFDFTGEGGPSFVDYDARPFFLTPRLLEVPCTVDYTGWAGPLRPSLHRWASTPALARLKAVGVLAKARVTNQVMLSPEGNTLEEMRALARALHARGLRTFTLSFHSPSVEPGHTPYVRSQADLDVFLEAVEGFCEFFLTELGGVPSTLLGFRTDVKPSAAPSGPVPGFSRSDT